MPATVQTVLATRIDRLPPAEKRLLQTAAVIGKDVPFRVLQAVAERPAAELQTSLSRLQAGELLYPVSVFPELDLTFKHALTHDVAYDSLLQERRKTLYARIMAAIEVEYGDRLDEHVERLAHHALRAESWEQAVRYCRQSGERAFARSAYREAVGHVEDALVALGKLPPSLTVREAEIDLRLDLRHALSPLGQDHRLLEILRKAESMAEEIGDALRAGRATSQVAYVLFLRGDLKDEAECAQRALRIGDQLGNLPLQVAARIRLTEIVLLQGDFRQAAEHARWMLAAVPEDASGRQFGTTVVPTAMFRSMLATALAQLGAFDEATRLTLDAVRVADAAGHPRSRLAAIS